MVIAQILILLTLATIFIQDIQSRSVYWILFPLLAVLLIVLRFSWQSLSEITLSVAINLGFLSLQMILLTAYFSLKNRRWVSLTKGWLGWGDLLFLIAIAFYLSFVNFLLFYIGSLVTVLLLWLIIRAIVKLGETRIPLAGMQALMLAIVLMLDWWYFRVNICADEWLLHYL